MKIWGRRNAFNVQKVLWLADELGLSYELVPAGGEFGRLNDPDFLALNPNGRIPVLEDGGLSVWESHAILRYLAATYGAETFWPDDAAARSLVDRWMDWAQTSLQPAFVNGIFWGYFRTPEAKRNEPAIRESIERTGLMMARLDDALSSQPYLAGEAFSLADIPAGTMLYRYFGIGLEWAPRKNVEAWYGRLQQRPAFRSNIMRPFDELKGKLSY